MGWLMGERTSDDPCRPNNPTELTYVRGVSSHEGGMKGIHKGPRIPPYMGS